MPTCLSPRLGQHLLRGLEPEHVEDDLQALDLGMAHRGERFLHRLDADAVVAELPRPHQVVEDAEHLRLAEQGRRRTVELQQIDGVHLEVLEAALDPRGQILARVAFAASAAGSRRPALVATQIVSRGRSRRSLRHEPLAAPVAVHVRGVDEVHAGIDRRVQRPHRLLVVHLAPASANRPRAEADGRDRHVRPAESPVVHDGHCMKASCLRGRGRVVPTFRSAISGWPEGQRYRLGHTLAVIELSLDRFLLSTKI